MTIPYWLRETFHLKNWTRKIKWAWQTHTRGYSQLDVWNAGPKICTRASRMLVDFAIRQELHGVPAGLYSSGVSDEEAMRKWKEIVLEMADGFDAVSHITGDCDCQIGEHFSWIDHYEKYHKRWERGMDLAKVWLMDVWD
jgi:hypothetical protein